MQNGFRTISAQCSKPVSVYKNNVVLKTKDSEVLFKGPKLANIQKFLDFTFCLFFVNRKFKLKHAPMSAIHCTIFVPLEPSLSSMHASVFQNQFLILNSSIDFFTPSQVYYITFRFLLSFAMPSNPYHFHYWFSIIVLAKRCCVLRVNFALRCESIAMRWTAREQFSCFQKGNWRITENYRLKRSCKKRSTDIFWLYAAYDQDLDF